MFKLDTKFDADPLLYLLSHFECDGHTVHMLTQWHLPPPLTSSTAKSSLFMHAHSSPLSLAARLHWCRANCSCYINNGWTFSGQTLYMYVCVCIYIFILIFLVDIIYFQWKSGLLFWLPVTSINILIFLMIYTYDMLWYTLHTYGLLHTHVIHSSKLKVQIGIPIIKYYKPRTFGDMQSPTNHYGFYWMMSDQWVIIVWSNEWSMSDQMSDTFKHVNQHT